jgi:uncharacterized membrane protein
VLTPTSTHQPQAIEDYLAAFEEALERVPAPVRHSEVDALREELSWLDSRGSAALLASLGSPTSAARTILIREVAARELRGRRAAIVGVAVGAAILGIGVTVIRRFLRTRCA